MFRVNVFNVNFLSQFKFVSLMSLNKFIIYSYSITYNIFMSINKKNFYFKNWEYYTYISKQLPLIVTKVKNWNKAKNQFFNSWKKILKQFFIVSYVKMRYKGKGYKLYFKKNKSIYLRFGFSHKNYHTNINNYSKFYIKWVLLSRVIFLGYQWRSLKLSILSLVKRRFANIFTLRGMILCRQVITKKTGKISTYF